MLRNSSVNRIIIVFIYFNTVPVISTSLTYELTEIFFNFIFKVIHVVNLKELCELEHKYYVLMF